MAPKKLAALQEQLQRAEEHYYKVSDKVSPISITTPVCYGYEYNLFHRCTAS
jgi:hypothetical protein